MRSNFVDALTESPIGVGLLAVLEAMQRPDVLPWDIQMEISNAQAVNRAAKWAATGASLGYFLSEAVRIAEWEIGPHVSDAPARSASAYRLADQRRPIALALAARLKAALHEPLDLNNQEWWTSPQERPHQRERPHDGGLLWTVQNLPALAHDAITDAWKFIGDTSRWHIDIENSPRIKEIHRPADWIELVERYPGSPANHGYNKCWKFDTPNTDRYLTWAPTGKLVRGFLGRLRDRKPRFVPVDQGLSELLALPGQKAAQPLKASQFVDVDWRAVSQDYDCCHLSWAGFITTEGYVCDLGDGYFTALHDFGSERTLWLSDVFGEATPLNAPEGLTGNSSGDLGVDASVDHQRAAQDRTKLEVTLGRRQSPPG